MAVYTYKATGPADDSVTGTIAADTPRQARDLLRGRGLRVRDVTDYRPSHTSQWTLVRPGMFSRSVSRRQTTGFVRDLATLLGVGMPLLEALETSAKPARGGLHTAIVLLRDRIAAGASLAAAMREQPRVFDALAVSIAEVGEDAGTLDTSLERLADFRERADQGTNKLTTALIYPLIVSLVGLFSTVFLMTFVVPKILQPLIEQDLPLPFPTRVVKTLSDGLVGWWWLIGIVLFAVTAAGSAILRSQKGRLAWDRLLLKLPLIGELAAKQNLVRVAEVLSTLLKSGIPFVRALQITQPAVSNRVIRGGLRQCELAISAGGDIGAAMESADIFPPMAVQVFALGQQSGRMEEMLDRLGKAYESQVASTSARLTALLEPAIILLLAGFVLFIVLATVLPILEVGDAIQ
jgi:general secretion pathway protein F